MVSHPIFASQAQFTPHCHHRSSSTYLQLHPSRLPTPTPSTHVGPPSLRVLPPSVCARRIAQDMTRQPSIEKAPTEPNQPIEHQQSFVEEDTLTEHGRRMGGEVSSPGRTCGRTSIKSVRYLPSCHSWTAAVASTSTIVTPPPPCPLSRMEGLTSILSIKRA